ncbi:MAG: hypothetical protein ACYTGB_15110, partial [Planctomycetota bacterium]
MKGDKRWRARRDLLIIAFFGVGVLLLSKFLDVFEALSGVARRYGSWEIGQLLVLFVVLPIPIGIFALRRWRELTSEIVEHGRTSEALAQS